MLFRSSSASITILKKFEDDFSQYMAVMVPKIGRGMADKSYAPSFAVETAIRDHPEWFELTFSKLRRPEKYYGKDPEFWIRERVTQGLSHMAVIA
ncbi:MAG: hypothetical protein V1862_09800 [Methanobacteriota archaeon]